LKHRKLAHPSKTGLKPSDPGPLRQLGNNLLSLGSLVFFGFLVVRDVFDLFPAIKPGGWLLLAAGFLLVVPAGVKLSDFLVRRTGIPEERTEWLAVLASMGLLALVIYSLRDLLGPLPGP